MKYYPINLCMKDRWCLIAGGGQVAFRKVNRLIQCEANIRIISPQTEKRLQEIASAANIEIVQRKIISQDLDGFFMIFAATNDSLINESIARWAVQKNILCNIADRPDDSDFILPSIIEQGDLNITISTNAKSPALSKYIATQLQEIFGPEYGIFLKLMGKLRCLLSNEITSQAERQKIYHDIVNSPILQWLKQNDMDSVSNTCLDLTGHSLADILNEQ